MRLLILALIGLSAICACGKKAPLRPPDSTAPAASKWDVEENAIGEASGGDPDEDPYLDDLSADDLFDD